MSSLTLSGVVLSLRITLALPVTVATLPIGSSGASAAVASGVAGSGAAAAGAAGCEGSVCACASCVSSDGACENFRRADRRAAGQQQEREGQLALHRGFPFTEEGEKAGPDFSVASLNAG